LLLKWNEVVAWILAGLSIYTLLQIYGVLRAFPKRPIKITKNGIFLKYSILSETYLSFKNIEKIEIFTKEIDKKGAIKYFSPFGKLEGNNVKIEFKNEQLIEGLYGKKRKMKSIVLFIDEKIRFIEKINKALVEKTNS
jgi:hypothetical protein